MDALLPSGKQTLAINADGSVGIAATPLPKIVVQEESLLRGHQLLLLEKNRLKAQQCQHEHMNKEDYVLMAVQQDKGLKSRHDPSQPIPQVLLSADPQAFTKLYLKDIGIKFDSMVEVKGKLGFIFKMKVCYVK